MRFSPNAHAVGMRVSYAAGFCTRSRCVRPTYRRPFGRRLEWRCEDDVEEAEWISPPARKAPGGSRFFFRGASTGVGPMPGSAERGKSGSRGGGRGGADGIGCVGAGGGGDGSGTEGFAASSPLDAIFAR